MWSSWRTVCVWGTLASLSGLVGCRLGYEVVAEEGGRLGLGGPTESNQGGAGATAGEGGAPGAFDPSGNGGAGSEAAGGAGSDTAGAGAVSEVAGAGGAGSEAGAAGLGAGGADIGSGAPVNAAGAGAGMSCTPVPDGPERDADGDGLIDVFDTDDDNDGISDLDECFPSAGRFINPGFEEPLVASSTPPDFDYYNVSLVPGWSNDTGTMEIWESGFQGIAAAVGLQFMELSARALDSLRQDVATVPGSTLRWGFYHRNRANEDDELELLIGAPAGLESQGHFTTGSAWILYEGTYSVPAGQTTTRFELVHVVPDYAAGNLVDHFDVEPICSVDTDADGCVDSEDPD